jgi:hypothetical protein
MTCKCKYKIADDILSYLKASNSPVNIAFWCSNPKTRTYYEIIKSLEKHGKLILYNGYIYLPNIDYFDDDFIDKIFNTMYVEI